MIARVIGRARRFATDVLLATGHRRRAVLSRLADASEAPGAARSGVSVHVLLCAPGRGNIGDQAMFEAFLERVSGPVVAITRAAHDVVIPAVSQDRVSVHALPDLVYGSGDRQRADLDEFARLVRGAASFSVVGADIMDGHYNNLASVTRAVLAEHAARVGVDARILGFSWNGAPRRAARSALQHAATAGVRILARDPRSAERLARSGIAPVQVADIVFGATTLEDSPWSARSEGRGYALVNSSALIARKLDLGADYAQVVRALLDDLDVILLPHVSRPGDDDRDACLRVARLVDDDRVQVVDTLLAPGQVRELARGATVVITGRMHLAIIALSQGVPAFVLATQGKVEGLIDLFGYPDVCTPPSRGFAAELVPAAREAMREGSRVRQQIAQSIPDVISLSTRNTDGLA